MNIIQKIVGLVGTTLIVADCLYPHMLGIHRKDDNYDSGAIVERVVERPIGRQYVAEEHWDVIVRTFDSSDYLRDGAVASSHYRERWGYRIDTDRLLVEVIILASATACLVCIFASGQPRPVTDRNRGDGVGDQVIR